jgi:type IV secretion system protein VirB4
MFDEGWKGLQDELLAKQILNWEKTIRKEEGIIVFGSNSPDDCGESYIGKQIIEQSPTKIFTPNPKATKEIYCDLFTLNQRELMLIKTLPKNSRKFLVKTPTESVVLTLDLSPLGEYLHVLSGRKKTVLLLDEIRAEVGDDPKDWMDIFLQKAGSI